MKINEIRNENIKEIFEKQKNNFQKESQSENSKDETSQRNNMCYQTHNLMLS